MVDTTHYNPKDNIEWVCKKILLGAIARDWDRQASHREVSPDDQASPGAQQSPPLDSTQFAHLGRQTSLAMRQPASQALPPNVYGWQHQAEPSRASTAYPPSWPSGAEFTQGQPMYPNGWQPPAPEMEPSQSQQGRQSSSSLPRRFELRSQNTFPTTYQH